MQRSAGNGTLRRIAIAITAAALALSAAVPAYAGTAAPGASGLGDGYFPLAGNGGYDVNHYDLDGRYKPATDVLFGHTRITATATQDLSSFNLDFVGMRIRSLTVDGVDATWDRQEHHELVVTPASPLTNGAEFVVVVDYDGVPRSPISYGARVGAVRTDDGLLIYGEPDVAAYWYPSNDHPQDKATFAIDLNVPAGLKAISNGALLGREPGANGRVTWRWEETDPMATYLAMAVIGRFTLRRYETNDGIPVIDAFDPRVIDDARTSLAKGPRVIRFLEDRFGPYPFDELGGVVDRWPGGFALETQTRPIYPPFPFVSLVVHELAHQWFGNSVSLHEWQHMWLNEGFASYAEWLWEGERGGRSPQARLTSLCGYGSKHRFWDVMPGDPGVDHLFDGAVYDRGAMTLQALRKTVGSADFFAILNTWLTDNANSTASTDDFITTAETVSGQELSAFFDEWLFTGQKPSPCVVGGPSRGVGATPQASAAAGGRS